MGITVLIFILIVLFCLWKYGDTEKSSDITITITPKENLSTEDYYAAKDLLKERLNVLVGEKNYTYESDREKFILTFDSNVIEDGITKETLEYHLLRPVQLYLVTKDSVDQGSFDETVKLDSDDISDVSNEGGHISFTVSKAVENEISSKYADEADTLYLVQDLSYYKFKSKTHI